MVALANEQNSLNHTLASLTHKYGTWKLPVQTIGVCIDTYVIYQSVLEKKTYEWLICDS